MNNEIDNGMYGFSDLEPLRKKVHLYSKLIGIGIVSFFVSLWIIPFLCFLQGGWVLIILFYVSFAIAGKIVLKNRKVSETEYNKAYKEVLVAPALAKSFDTYTYRPEAGISTDEVLRLWNQADFSAFNIESEDLLTGTYNGVYYEQSDLRVTMRRKSDRKLTGFSGCVSKFRFDKNISGKLIVCTQMYDYSSSQLSEVKTENEEFNNNFNIYAENEHDAFYILTPHFMEAMLKLYKALPLPLGAGRYIKNLRMLFENDTLVMLRGNVRMFEVPIGREIDFIKDKERIIKDMRQLLDIVDILNMGHSSN